jgi:hypothetical protein
VSHNVDVPNSLPVGALGLRATADSDAGVGAEQVDASFGDVDLFDELSHVCLDRDVAANRHSTDLTCDGPRAVPVDVGNDDRLGAVANLRAKALPMPLAPPVTTTTRSATSIEACEVERLRRSRCPSSGVNGDYSCCEHRAHHDREPRHRRNQPDLTCKGCASEDRSAGRSAEDDESTARQLLSESDQGPGANAYAYCDHHEVHDVDQKNHSGSLRRTCDVPTAREPARREHFREQHWTLLGSHAPRTVTR